MLTESELWNKLDKVVNALSEEASALNEETAFLITLSPDEIRYLELIRKQERLA